MSFKMVPRSISGVAIGILLLLNLSAAAQGLNPPLSVRIDAPSPGSYQSLADPLPVRITATSDVDIASVLVAFDSNGNGVIEAPDEVRQALPQTASHTFLATFEHLSGSSGIRAIQAIAADSSLHTASTVSRIALSPQESPPIGVSRPFEMIFGMGEITAVAVSPDGTRALLGGGQGFAVLIDLPSGHIVRHLFGHTEAITSAAFAHNEPLAVTASKDGKALLWDTTTGSLRRIFTHLYGNGLPEINAVAFSPDDTQLLTGTKRANSSTPPLAWLWEIDSGQLIHHFTGHGGHVLAVTFSPDGQRVATGSADQTVRLWETATGNPISTFSGHTRSVQAVAFSPSGTQLLTGGSDNTARLYDVATGAFKLLTGHGGNINAVAFSPDSALAATASADDTIRLWDTTDGRELQVFEGHEDDVWALAFVSGVGPRQLLSSSADGTARLWDISLDAATLTYTEHTAAINAVVAGLLPDRTEVRLTGSADGTARLWHAASGVTLRTFPGHPTAVTAVAISPDGTRVLTGTTGSRDRRIRLWNTETDVPIYVFPKEDGEIRAIGFSADGTRVLSGTATGTVKIWDLTTNPPRPVSTLTLPGGTVQVMAFSPDGTLVLRDGSPDPSNSRFKPVTLWRLNTDPVLLLRTFTGHRGSLLAATFSENGAYVLTGGQDSTARIWQVASGAERTLLNRSDVKAVAFAPDGIRMLTADITGAISLWDTASGNRINQFKEHTGMVNAVAFSRDGHQVLSAGSDGMARARPADAGMTSLIFEGGDITGITAIGLPSDGDQIATSSWNNVIVRLWNRANGEQLKTLRGHQVSNTSATTRVDSIDFSLDGTRILTGSGDGTARVWDRGSGTTLHTVIVPGNNPIISTVNFAPDGASFLTGDNKNGLYQWATTGGETPLAPFTGHTGTGGINAAVFSLPGGAQVLSGGSQDHVALLWDTATTTQQASFGHTSAVTAVAFSPDGTRLLTGSDDGTAQLWDPSAPTSPLQRVYYGTPRTGGSTNPVAFNSVAFAPDSRQFLTNSADGTARLWDEQGRLLRPFEHYGPNAAGSTPKSAKMSGDGQWVLTNDGSNAARLWSSVTWPIQQTITEDGGIQGIASAAHSGQILTATCKGSGGIGGSTQGSVHVWNTAGELLQALYENSPDCPRAVALSPDDALVLTNYGNAIRLWDKGSGNKVRDFPIREYAVYAFTFSPNGAWIATGSQEINPVSCSQNCGSVKLYDAITGIQQHLFQHPVGVRAIAFSPDGSQLLTGSGDRLARLWNIAGETVMQTFAGHAGLITSVAFSPDPSRRWVLTGSQDQTALLWDADTGTPLRIFLHPSALETVAFDPSGDRVVTTAGQTAYVWDTASGALLGAVGHKLGINAAIFSADGARLLTGGDDGTAQVWAVRP